MLFSYRTRQRFRRLRSAALVLILVLALALVFFAIWLRRFMIYTPDGVRLDFSVKPAASPGKVPSQPEKVDISMEYIEPGETLPEAPVIQQERLTGYYIDSKMLQTDIDGLRQQLFALPAGTAVLLDVKNFWGYFYYSSNQGPRSDSYVLSEVDALIADLTQSDLYVIARLPALRDYEFGLNNVSCGLPTKQGYLWTDDSGCYWLDPTDDGTLTYLIQIAKELRSLGFDEVVFKDFYVPDASKIVFSANRREAIEAAAQTLVTACATDSFAVSFVGYTIDLQMPEGNSRLYLENVTAAQVSDVLDMVNVSDPARNVVFFAETNDTRYDICGTMRPLELAH